MFTEINTKLWNQIPNDIIQNILVYDDRFKFRSGKWMTQLSKNDERYKILKTIPKKYNYCISSNNEFGAYRETYVIFPNKKYLLCRIENDFYLPRNLVIQYFYVYSRSYIDNYEDNQEVYSNRSYVVYIMPSGDF